MVTDALYFSGLATAFYIATNLVFAAVRWFHICRPYDKNPDYYFPGRKNASLTTLASLVLLPYAIQPYSPSAWLITKAYFLPAELYFLTVLLFSYFGNVMHWEKWQRPALWTGIPGLAGLVLAPFFAGLFQKWHFGSFALANGVIFGLGVIMTGIALWSARRVLRWARSVNDEEYSNPDDFPVVFARKTVYMVLVIIALLWAAALADNRIVTAVLELLLSGFTVILLIGVLQPHRHQAVESEEMQETPAAPAEETSAAAATEVYRRTLSESKALTILSAISEVVVEQQAFLDPHLTIQDVADRAGYNRTYIAGLFKTELGGFFNFINTLRLDYADQYKKEHPDATLSEVISESGFASRTTYYAVRARMQREE